MNKSPTVLVILDGWGIGEPVSTNAVFAANTPNFDRISNEYPKGQLKAHGYAVGLPEGQMGNSEVGHMTIGAGRVVWMDLPKIDRAIEVGELAKNPRIGSAIQAIKAQDGAAHVLGLCSAGGVHAHEMHIAALANIFAEAGMETWLHLFTDGRDVAPKSAQSDIPKWLGLLEKSVKIATVSGRFYAMDRDNRWERVEAAYRAIVDGQGERADDVLSAISAAYQRGETDEFVTPTVIGDYQGMKTGDGAVFANFRADRAREILHAIGNDNFEGFERKKPQLSRLLGMVNYSDQHDGFMETIFPKAKLQNTLGEVVARAGGTQFRLAETEKYPHVTFFFNGGEEAPNAGEARHMAPSPKVRTYDLQPEMSAPEVGDELERAILSGQYDLIVCNFANPDMVGHTGDLIAAVRAVEAVDHELGRAVRAIEDTGGRMIVTADHGNCDIMVDPKTGEPHTAHTLNPVQYVVIGHDGTVAPRGGLSDLAPTILALMGIEQPEDMSGECLLAP